MKNYQTLLYYCYSHIDHAEQFAADHLEFCKSLGLVGRIIVADEGLNGTVSGTPEACQAYMDAVHADPRFAKTDFKIDEAAMQTGIKAYCYLVTDYLKLAQEKPPGKSNQKSF